MSFDKVDPFLASNYSCANLPRIILLRSSHPQPSTPSPFLIVSNAHLDQVCAIGPLPVRQIRRLKAAAASGKEVSGMLPSYNLAYQQSALWTSSATGVMPPTTHGICATRHAELMRGKKEIWCNAFIPFGPSLSLSVSLSFSFSFLHMIGCA